MRKRLLVVLVLPLLVVLTGLACGLGSDESQPLSQRIEDGVDTMKGALASGEYVVNLIRQFATLSQSQENLEELLLAPEVGNVRWTGSVRAQLAVVNVVCDQIVRLPPPASVATLHAAITDACGDCRQAVQVTLDGLDALDTTALTRSVQLGKQCISKLESNQALLGELATGLDLDLPDLDSATNNPPTVNAGSNLRAGPGTNYDRVGGLREGTVVAVVGRNGTGDWLVIETEGQGQAWIAAFLVENAPELADLPVLSARE